VDQQSSTLHEAMQKSLGEGTSWEDRRKLTRAIFDQIKSNLFPKNDYKWGERKQGEEGIYAEPEITQGEVDAFHGGGAFKKFSLGKVKSGEGNIFFGHGGYFSSQKGVAESYRNQYMRKHGYSRAKIEAFDKEKFRELIKDETKNILTPEQTDEFLKFDKYHTRENWIVDRVGRLNELVYSNPQETLKRSVAEYMKDSFREARRDKWIAKHVDPGKNIGGLGFSKALGIEKQAELEVDVANRIAERLSRKLVKSQKSAGLYKAKLWEGKQENLIDWYEPISKENAEKIALGLTYDHIERAGKEIPPELVDKQLGIFFNRFHKRGLNAYNDLSNKLGSDKAASEFLNSVGIDGIRYPVGTLSGGGKGYNYVVFDEEAIKVKRIE